MAKSDAGVARNSTPSSAAAPRRVIGYLRGLLGLKLAEAFARFLFLAFAFHARLFIVLALLHFLQQALFNELLFEDPQGFIDLIIADNDFHDAGSISAVELPNAVKITAQSTGSPLEMSRIFFNKHIQ